MDLRKFMEHLSYKQPIMQHYPKVTGSQTNTWSFQRYLLLWISTCNVFEYNTTYSTTFSNVISRTSIPILLFRNKVEEKIPFDLQFPLSCKFFHSICSKHFVFGVGCHLCLSVWHLYMEDNRTKLIMTIFIRWFNWSVTPWLSALEHCILSPPW